MIIFLVQYLATQTFRTIFVLVRQIEKLWQRIILVKIAQCVQNLRKTRNHLLVVFGVGTSISVQAGRLISPNSPGPIKKPSAKNTTLPNMLDKLRTGIKSLSQRIISYLSRLSPRTGAIVLALCIPCYIISFAQMCLPLSTAAKGVLWFIFFGMAKTTQYAGLTILGATSIKNIIIRHRQHRQRTIDENN